MNLRPVTSRKPQGGLTLTAAAGEPARLATLAPRTAPARRESGRLFVWFDRLGVGLSGLCVVHCLVTPILLLLLPALESSAAHEGFHRALLFVLPPLALFAFIPGYRKHGRWLVFALGVPGLALIALGALAFANQPYLEAGVSIAGSLALILAHLYNRRALVRAGFGHVHLHGDDCNGACGHTHGS